MEPPKPRPLLASGNTTKSSLLTTVTVPTVTVETIPDTSNYMDDSEIFEEESTFNAVDVTPVSGAEIHEVSAGETLWAISRAYGIEMDDLLGWNQLSKYDPISIGQKLYVQEPPSANPVDEVPLIKTKEYVVLPGDTFYRIAKNHEMSVSELMKLNKRDSSTLEVGEKILVKDQ
jgi:membrane-bound lytic murein transglycosylase D